MLIVSKIAFALCLSELFSDLRVQRYGFSLNRANILKKKFK